MTLAPPKSSAMRGPRWSPLFVLTIATGLTIFASYYAYQNARVRTKAEFEGEAMDALAAIRARMEANIALLRGGVALASAETNLTRATFRSYVQGLHVPANYPGIQGIGITTRLRPEQLPEFVDRVRREGATTFAIRPETPREEYHPITYLEPLDVRNVRAIGYDMFTEPVRREAMEKARDKGVPVTSGKVELVQEIENPKQAGFLLYLPVYEGGEVPFTQEGRREKLRAFIYSPFRADDLFRNILSASSKNMLRTEVFDGRSLAESSLLHDSGAGVAPRRVKWRYVAHVPLQLTDVFEIAGHIWTIRFSSEPGTFQANLLLSGTIMIAGSLLSLLLGYLTWAEGRARTKAEESSARLGASEQSLRDARVKLEQYARELEQRVHERTANLEQSVQSLEGVLYHVAHDLRAPLRAMASFTSILEEEYPERLDARGADYIRRIARAARRMDELVHDLLSYGRLGHVPMPLETLDLAGQIDAVLDQFSESIRSKKARVEVKSPMPKVKANERFLQEVIAQLLSNALKFVPDGIAPHVKIWATPANNLVRLWIEDNGIGIQDKYHERVFRVFERLHGHDSYSGTGIGLAIVSKAVERMSGSVGVESTLGQGSRFWIELAAG